MTYKPTLKMKFYFYQERLTHFSPMLTLSINPITKGYTMSGNIFGQIFKLVSFGESHGQAIGGVICGSPPNCDINIEEIQSNLNKRKPGSSPFVTPRLEDDKINILSGIYNGKTLGTPIAFIIPNHNQKSSDYNEYKNIFRPGHADYTYFKKYGFWDHRGGGRASARETAIRVAAGSIAQQILSHIIEPSPIIRSCITRIGPIAIKNINQKIDWQFVQSNEFNCPCPETLPLMIEYINTLKNEGKSAGANILLEVSNVPAGIGNPVFDKIDAILAQALMSINAVKTVAIGDTFDIASQEIGYDEMETQNEKIIFHSNHSGGILGGITSGQDIRAIIGFKPTSSTLQPRKTTNTDGDNITIQIKGRHDPCVALRACPIVNAMAALTLLDQYLVFRGQCGK